MLTDEQRRILRAARDGRLRTGERWLWLIEGEERPMSHERTRLRDIGLLRSYEHADGDYFVGLPTDKGRQALADAAEVA